MSHFFAFNKPFLFVITLLYVQFAAVAQKADFTANQSSGCSPLAVSFTNISTGFSSSATYNWEFGNGNTSTKKDAGATYIEPKTYTVKLTVTEGAKTDSKTATITVYKKPTVDFTASIDKGCQPLPVTFNSLSTAGDGTIQSYYWDYGDGNSESTGAQPQHTYTIPQTVTASLTVTNSFGCYAVLSKPEIVKVFPSVTAAFTANETVLCNKADAVSFTNTSAGSGALMYAWDFGDGTTSTDKTPTHVFGKRGTYTIKLGVKSSDGCKNEIVQTDYINVANFTTDFSVPPLICENTDALFYDISNPKPTSNQHWLINGLDYGYYYDRMSHTFYGAGTYKMQLINTYGNCLDTATKDIKVLPSPNITGFIADMQGACGSPVTVKFKDTTSNTTKWSWDFNYNYNNFNPTAATQSTSYSYKTDGSYYIMLQATNAAGCTAQKVQSLNIYKPYANIQSSHGSYGCTNLATVFSASSQSTLKAYSWNFGDGTTSTETTPSHTFTKQGYFNVILSFTDSNGCKGTANFSVSISGKPSFDFTASPGTTICGNTPVNFIVTGANTTGNYSWNFGDRYDGYYYSSLPVYQYYQDSTFTVSLIISNEGCADTVTKKNYIKVLPPFPKIASVVNTCNNTRGLVTFAEASVKATGWSWDFGDNSAANSYTTFQDSIKHTYAKTGSYKVVLTAKNGGCSVRDSTTAYVLIKQKPTLSSPQTEVCGSDVLPVTITNLENNPYYTFYNNYYNYFVDHFEYGDSTRFNGNIPYYYQIQNNSQLTLSDLDNTKKGLRLITNSYYFNCADTTNYITIKVKGPTAGYKLANNNKCFKTPVVFTDTSKGSNGAPIVKWEWSFGDGFYQTTTGGDISHLFSAPGEFYTTLKVTDKDGCSASVTRYDAVTTGTKASFYLSSNPVLPDVPVYFYNNSYGSDYYNNTYTWLFGDGTKENSASYYSNINYSYSETGTDTIKLIVKDEPSGCIDTAIQYLNVKNINLSFDVTTSYINPGTGCPPMLAKFTNTSINTTSVKWDFGDGGTADNLNYPSHIYEKPGKYKVTIYGTFYDNSIDSSFDYVTIQGPFATLKTDRLFACGSQVPVTLSAEESNSSSYTWDFGDGTLTDATDTFATHTYLTPGVYTPSLIVKDGNNCSFSFFLDEQIVIDTLHVTINKNPLVNCDSSLTLFTPDITSVAKNDRELPLTYLWNFGTGKIQDTANTETTSFVYNDTGYYPVSLHVASPYGCVEEASVNIAVKSTPKGSISGVSSICDGASALFTGSANVTSNTITWQWYFPNNSTSSQQAPSSQIFTAPGLNSVQLIVNNGGCSDTVYHDVVVYAKPAIDITPENPFVCAGSSVQLTAHDGNSYSWLTTENISNQTVANPFVSPLVTTSYSVKVTNDQGCVNQDSVTVRVRQPFTVAASPLFYLCKGSSMELQASGADVYQWTGTALNNNTISNPVTSTTKPQTYTVVGFDNDHCFTDTATTEVRIAELPSVKTIEDAIVFAGSPVDLITSGSNDITAWNWTPKDYLSCGNCASPTSHPKSDMLYIVKATTGYGCTKEDSVNIHILCKQSLVQIPGAFTPEGDSKNDRFTIKGQGIKRISHFVIFNRSGVAVFEKTNISANDPSAGWDGTYMSRPVDPGSYVYMANIICDTGEIFHYKGTVVVIR